MNKEKRQARAREKARKNRLERATKGGKWKRLQQIKDLVNSFRNLKITPK